MAYPRSKAITYYFVIFNMNSAVQNYNNNIFTMNKEEEKKADDKSESPITSDTTKS